MQVISTQVLGVLASRENKSTFLSKISCDLNTVSICCFGLQYRAAFNLLIRRCKKRALKKHINSGIMHRGSDERSRVRFESGKYSISVDL